MGLSRTASGNLLKVEETWTSCEVIQHSTRLNERENGKGGVPGRKEEKSMSEINEVLLRLFGFSLVFLIRFKIASGSHLNNGISICWLPRCGFEELLSFVFLY